MQTPPDLSARFEAARPHLRAVALRVLGSASEADDAVQEAWLKLSGADTREVSNLTGWLTTVVARVCLDMLRARRRRRAEDVDDLGHDEIALADSAPDPERANIVASAIGPALLLVLDSLPPAERLAFVLHDMFAVPFEEIGSVLRCSSDASRQLASRGRRRVRGATTPEDEDHARRHAVVDAFLDASREGKLDALLAILAPDVVVHADATARALGSAATIVGSDAVARTFSGRAAEARHALVEGSPGAAWVPRSTPKVALSFTIVDGLVTAIRLVGDPTKLAETDMVILDA